MATITVNWKFKGSSGASRPYKTQSPCTAGQLRTYLKEVAGVHTIPSLDILLSFEDKPDIVISDNLNISNKSNFVIQRMRSEDAQHLISEANAKYDAEISNLHHDVYSVTSAQRNSLNEVKNPKPNNHIVAHQYTTEISSSHNNSTYGMTSSSLHIHQNITTLKETPTHTDYNNFDEPDEDQKINEMMAQHAEHRGPMISAHTQEGLGQRYYRNRNLKWSADQPDQTYIPATSTHAYIPSNKNINKYSHTPSTSNHSQFPANSSNHNYSQSTPSMKVSVDYICHLCGEKGHNIRNCPNSHSQKHFKKIKPATGIPNNFFTPISADDISKYSEVYIMKDRTFAVMRDIESVSARAYFSKSVDQRVQQRLGNSATHTHTSSSDNFKCSLCGKLFINPVVTPCCGETFCSKCLNSPHSNIPRTFRSKFNPCPVCGELINPSQLTPNKAVKEAVEAILKGSSAKSNTQSYNPSYKKFTTPFEAQGNEAEDPGNQNRLKRTTTSTNPIKVVPIKRIKSEIK